MTGNIYCRHIHQLVVEILIPIQNNVKIHVKFHKCMPNHTPSFNCKGLARTQIPTNKNYAIEFPTFGEIAGVSHPEVQWNSLALEEPPW